ncbi:uncharacterized protein STEHIDRAFT_140201 [Stereum hirsutum FP-91666 SS1]|uniref:uncharacterized protein n=1 Tax=Stereum hirsutum (strain FP-91666) TaxID=721885 RepID=UPI000444996B|nr:uncharacterized protein STEHIDRAFT_140201 [Stereum hirsutum FP-91666 SS1]EIM85629.1 hypothetical protein STEHIDRAFT_140201 [Stereum hirsutum FP-91666 SS1]
MLSATFSAFFFFACAACVLAIPTWENFSSRNSMGDFVPGASVIEAKGGPYGRTLAFYLSNTSPRGTPGNATLEQTSLQTAPKLFIDKSKLYMYTNDTFIQPVNVLNVTSSTSSSSQSNSYDPLGYKLTIGDVDKPEGLPSAWSWTGTVLNYESGLWRNRGIYYYCVDRGIYLSFTRPSLHTDAAPEGCYVITLHSYSHLALLQEKEEAQARLGNNGNGNGESQSSWW